MAKDKQIIERLLEVIGVYEKNQPSKDLVIDTRSINDQVVITRLVTSGESDIRESPFYSGAMKTCIIEEFYVDGEVIFANMLYSER